MPYTVFPDALYDPTPAAKRNGIVAPEEWLEVIDNLGGVTSSLGTNPAQSTVTGLNHGTVDARLEAIETAVAAFGATGIRNLRITNATATPNTLAISWSTLGIQGVITQGFSATLDRGDGPGANGRDADFTFGNSTWYWLYAIYGDAAGVAVLLSENGESTGYVPFLPTGYTRYRRIGAVVTDTGGNFRRFLQQDCFATFVHSGDVYAYANLTETGLTARSFVAWMPDTSRNLLVRVLVLGPTGSALVVNMLYRPTGSGVAGHTLVQAYGQNDRNGTDAWVVTDANRSIDTSLSAAPAGAAHYLTAAGYYDPI